MKQISFIFSKRSVFNVFSSLIIFGLKTPFSHVAIKMIDGDTGQMVYWQASGLAVNCVGEAEFLSKETIIYQKDLTISDSAFVTGKTFTINQLGKPYSILAILGFALQILFGMLYIKISNPFSFNGSQYVCSQLAAAYLDACEDINLDVTNMTPLAFYQAIQSLPIT